jgi:methylated-DNA-[protein]-cysteine S-methyltransferase
MKQRRTILPCGFHEEALIAVALDEAETTLQQAVTTHVSSCQACEDLLRQYQNLQQIFTGLQHTGRDDALLQQAQAKLVSRFAPQPTLRLSVQRLTSAVGKLYIVASARGVALLTWEAQAAPFLSRLVEQRQVEMQENAPNLHGLIAAIQAYLAGSPTRLTWPLDDLFVPTPFQRKVLHMTATIPYGAVMSYKSIAAALGQPQAVRAVAQALRRNPLALLIPCHRVVAQQGHLLGYTGGLEKKRALLTLEGIPLLQRPHGFCIDTQHMYVGWRTERAYCRPHCPSLTTLAPGEKLLLAPRAITALRDYTPCDVCHPEVTSA